MVNSIWQTIEVRQVEHDPVFSLRHNEEMPMRWRPGVQNIQVCVCVFARVCAHILYSLMISSDSVVLVLILL
jgi:hypothetical protein